MMKWLASVEDGAAIAPAVAAAVVAISSRLVGERALRQLGPTGYLIVTWTYLATLVTSLPHTIWNSGGGGTFFVTVLTRAIQAMRMLNPMALKQYLDSKV